MLTNIKTNFLKAFWSYVLLMVRSECDYFPTQTRPPSVALCTFQVVKLLLIYVGILHNQTHNVRTKKRRCGWKTYSKHWVVFQQWWFWG